MFGIKLKQEIARINKIFFKKLLVDSRGITNAIIMKNSYKT